MKKEMMPEDTSVDRLTELNTFIDNSLGMRVVNSRAALANSLHIFEGNYHDLLHHIGVIADEATAIQFLDERNARTKTLYQRETMRFTINFLASAISLLDHFATLVDYFYKGTPFADQYQAQYRELFLENPFACFMREFRNYAVHENLTPVAIQWKMSFPGGFQSSIAINTDTLRKNRKWRHRALAYLETLEVHVDLAPLITEYHALVRGYYDWLVERHMANFEAELREVEAAQAELAQEWARIDPR